ncbi:hypothetical protein MKT69_07910 [Leptospira borgpetersenii]|uniref:hypothetical protein n=1 Tax=Leptospira borgpetersenii TaxID=174 RepID=UPI0027DC469E|nr:hypothetical protein [Leptospira borgpetersenii]MCH1889503.1 hypothetical protein [Leptospira borgpetersenii]
MTDFFQLNPGEILSLAEKAGYEPSGHCMALIWPPNQSSKSFTLNGDLNDKIPA